VTLQYIDLFAGCGGLSDGFDASGRYRGIAHVEWEAAPLETLTERLVKIWNYARRDLNTLLFDIQDTKGLLNGGKDRSGKFLPGLTSLTKSNVDLLIGGPPCQAYSSAGRVRDENGMQDDYRNYLFESYVSVLKWARPKFFLFENVPGILSAKPGGIKIIERIRTAFSQASYLLPRKFEEGLFNLEDFGVPQKRSRVFILGVREDLYKQKSVGLGELSDFFASFRRDYRVDKVVSASKALSGLPPLYPTNDPFLLKRRISHQPAQCNVTHHIPRFHNSRDVETFRMLAEDLQSGRGLYTSVDRLKALYTERTGKQSAVHKYHVIRPNEPSNTIPAHLAKDGLRHIHWDPTQKRSITVREAARLQGFDDDFNFLGTQSDQYRMIGNAVPPIFSQKIATHLASFFSKKF
jgi:DNA (cytosine-5)-methyltransferase 1